MSAASYQSRVRDALRLTAVTCTYPSSKKGAAAFTPLQNASLVVNDGDFVSIVGPTGCGKTTLLNVAAGLLPVTSGEVLVFGSPLVGINRNAGYMFQSDALLPWLTARGNVSLGLEFASAPKSEAQHRATEWLSRVGLSGHEHRHPHQLSGGMKKRVALAQVLALEPEILLMDEPFSALDVQTRQLMENELLDIWSANKTSVMFVTHDLEEAISLSDRVVVLAAGPATSVIAEFKVDIPRPRDVTEIVHAPRYREIHQAIWGTLKAQVLESYQRNNA
jgi:NitT/TauT family transport system ATP-binding protein